MVIVPAPAPDDTTGVNQKQKYGSWKVFKEKFSSILLLFSTIIVIPE